MLKGKPLALFIAFIRFIDKKLPIICVENFECRRNQAYHLHSVLAPSSPPFACDFSPTLTDLILIAQEDGLVHLYDTSVTGSQAFLKHYEAHNNAVFDVKWLSSGSSFLTASGDQSIRLIDAETGVIIQQFFGHTMSVRSLSFMPSDCHIFASTSRDGSIRMWDTRVKPDAVNFRGSPGISSVGVLPQCHVPSWPNSSNTDGRKTRTPKRVATDAQSVTSVLFVDDNTFLSAGSSDGSIKMWDLRRVFCVGSKKQAKPKFVLPYSGTSQKQSGYSDLVVNSYRKRLFANCLDNVVYEYDLTQSTTQPVFIYTGHVTDSFYVKLDISPDDSYIICGSSDRRAHIYAVGKRQQQPIVLSGHTGEVSVARWCKGDPTRIVTLSDESQAFVWNMFPARRYTLPDPGELAGLAELISPSKSLMNLSQLEKRILCPTVSQSNNVDNKSGNLSLPNFDSRSPMTSARRRQSNIRHFLETVSPPVNSSTLTSTASKSLVALSSLSNNVNINNSVMNSNLQIKRLSSLATLTETLGGVVQRFPGLSTGFANTHSTPSTPPLGCYSLNSANRSPFINTPTKNESPITPEQLLIHPFFIEDSENINPDDLRNSIASQGLPLDCVDGRVLNQSPIVRCSVDRPTYDPDSHVTPSKRLPLSLNRSLYNTPPQSEINELSAMESRKRQRSDLFDVSPGLSPTLLSSTRMELSNSINRVREKRRRLTAFPSTSQPVVSPNTTPIVPMANSRRRRMTTVCPSVSNPITKYFKKK
ncbi:Denticleless protein [Schistosoma japonicum]|uniref:Denticleless protein n=1 Tax=Schistosoma japonicum TaxID=6182 RepID=A0A4Z2DMJ7_SCHJA|nr:Denticleless protein [Schistosoma japonicum]